MRTPDPLGETAGNEDEGLSWEAGPGGRGLRGAWSTTSALLFDPAESIGATHLGGGLWPAFSYFLGMSVFASVASQVVKRVLMPANAVDVAEIVRAVEDRVGPEGAQLAGQVLELVAGRSATSWLFVVTWAFLFWTLYIFAASAFAHVCLMLTGAADGGFEATFKALAYTHGATAVLMLVPMCGALIQLLWLTVILVMALVDWHRTSTTRVVLGLSLPLIPLVCCAAGLAAAIMTMARTGGAWGSY